MLAQLCTRLGISADYVLLGEGEMRRGDPAGERGATGPPDLPGTAVRGVLRAEVEAAQMADGVREAGAHYGVDIRLADLAAIQADMPEDVSNGIIAAAIAQASSARELARLREAVDDLHAVRGRV